MRFYVFLALAGIVLGLDLLFMTLALVYPSTIRPLNRGVAYAAPRMVEQTPLPSTTQSLATQPSHPTAEQPGTLTFVPSPISTPTLVPSPISTPTLVPSPTSTPEPAPSPFVVSSPAPRVVAEHSVTFAPHDRAVRHNIEVALAYEYSALKHVFVPPGGVFSFNAVLGATPERLPWKSVAVNSGSGRAPVESENTSREWQLLRIPGGGLCDLASRYVMASRLLLPPSAFRFVNHVRSTGIGLRGVPKRDAVSIWAVGGGPGEKDLKITNATDQWLEFVVEQDGEQLTVRARLWDRMPR